MITANIIADSIDYRGNRLTTFVLVFPRIILAEFNTHRALSRNSASSRAIPFNKMIQQVKDNPFIPIRWMKEHKGMQGYEYYGPEDIINIPGYGNVNAIEHCKAMWLDGRNAAIQSATNLNIANVTKQFCNRMLETYMYHTVIVTGSNWENFFALRANSQAEIHMQDLAFKMLQAYNDSEPHLRQVGDWHIPFGKYLDIDQACKQLTETGRSVNDLPSNWEIKIATARCARVSYMTFENEIDYKKDIELHDNLAKSGHWSPFEHCARVSYWNLSSGNLGNGWLQYRKMFSDEDKTDPRVKKRTLTVN